MTEAEISELLSACSRDLTPRGRRDAAILSLLCGTGLAQVELCGLLREDCSEKVIAVRYRAVIRRILISEGVGAKLAEWIRVRGEEPGPLFHPIDKSGKMERRHVSASAVNYLLGRRAIQAGISPISVMDVLRTQRLVSCNQWDIRCCCLVAPCRDILPLGNAGRQRAAGTRGNAALGRCDPLESSRAAVLRYLGRLDRGRRQSANAALDALAQAIGGKDALHFEWARLSNQQLRQAAKIFRPTGSRTFSQIKQAVSGLLNELTRLAIISQDERRGLRGWDRNPESQPHRGSEDLAQVLAVLEHCSRGDSVSSARDGALVALLVLATSLRATLRDVIGLMRSDLESIGETPEMGPASPTLRGAVERWLALRGVEAGPLLTRVTRGGQIRMERMSRSAVACAIRKRAIEAGSPALSAEGIRRMAIAELISARIKAADHGA